MGSGVLRQYCSIWQIPALQIRSPPAAGGGNRVRNANLRPLRSYEFACVADHLPSVRCCADPGADVQRRAGLPTSPRAADAGAASPADASHCSEFATAGSIECTAASVIGVFGTHEFIGGCIDRYGLLLWLRGCDPGNHRAATDQADRRAWPWTCRRRNHHRWTRHGHWLCGRRVWLT